MGDVKQLNELLIERARLGVREPPVLVADRPVRVKCFEEEKGLVVQVCGLEFGWPV